MHPAENNNEEVAQDDSDLLIQSVGCRSSPVASQLAVATFRHVSSHPGCTVDDIYESLRIGWPYTEAYRRYRSTIDKDRRRRCGNTARLVTDEEYDTGAFKNKAIRHAIERRLFSMVGRGTIVAKSVDGAKTTRVSGARLFPGRPPVIHMDVAAHESLIKEDTERHIARENLKGEILRAIRANPLGERRAKRLLQSAYDYICNR